MIFIRSDNVSSLFASVLQKSRSGRTLRMEKCTMESSNCQMFYTIILSFYAFVGTKFMRFILQSIRLTNADSSFVPKFSTADNVFQLKLWHCVHGYSNYLFPVKLWTPIYFNLWGESQRSLAVLSVWMFTATERKVTDTLVYFNCGKSVIGVVCISTHTPCGVTLSA